MPNLSRFRTACESREAEDNLVPETRSHTNSLFESIGICKYLSDNENDFVSPSP